MSLTNKILKILKTRTYSYKGVPLNAFMLPIFSDYSRKAISNRISYLRKNDYISVGPDTIFISKKGEEMLKKPSRDVLKHFSSPFDTSSPKNLLLMYDIPHFDRIKRDWFRRQLKSYGFVMIQKSVWVGPSPLPKEFTLYLKSIHLTNSIKTFKLAQSYKTKA